MATASKGIDRRAQRTRQVLQRSFIEVAQTKGLMATSIQEVTERANLSRGTFYAHYADKYALIEAIVREEFQRQFSLIPLTADLKGETFRQFTQTFLEFFNGIYRQHHLSGELTLLVEKAIREELAVLILAWLKHPVNKQSYTTVPLANLAQVMSWTIFGAAVQYCQETQSNSSEHMVSDVLLALKEVVRLIS